MDLTVFQHPPRSRADGGDARRIIYLYGPPAAVFRALWSCLEGSATQRHFDRVGLLRTADDIACAELAVPPGRSYDDLVARMKRVDGVQLLLPSDDGEPSH